MKKTMSFAVVHFSVAFSITYAMTGSLVIGGALALIEPSVNTLAFYLHEKVWQQGSRLPHRAMNMGKTA